MTENPRLVGTSRDDSGVTSSDPRRSRVVRLLQYVHELVRTRSTVVRDLRDHEAVLWLGADAGLPVDASAAPGEVVLRVSRSDMAAYSRVAQVIDELAERPESVELVVASGLLRTGTDIDADGTVYDHLISQPVVAHHDHNTGVIEIRLAADFAPDLHDLHLLTGEDGFDLSASAQLHEELVRIAPSPFASSVPDFLRSWFARVVDDATAAQIEDQPALVLRRRDSAALLNYFETMIAGVRDTAIPVPIGLAQLVEGVEASERLEALASSGAMSAEELVDDALYPLPSNVEQRDILSQLGTDSGVVVEGPPGTGKTHTIANLLSALLAKGQRVLVVSEKAQALHVLRDKMPPELQELVVSITDVTKDGSQSLVESVEAIANRKASYQPRVAEAEIKNIRSKRDQARAKREQTMREIWRMRESETEQHDWVSSGYSGTAAEVVRQTDARAAEFSWLPGPLDSPMPVLDNDEFARLLALLRSRGAEADNRLAHHLPDIDHLIPDPVEMESICTRIAGRPDERMVGSGSLLAILKGVDSQRLLAIKQRCERLSAAVKEVRSYPPTMQAMTERLLTGEAAYLWERVTDLADIIDDAVERDKAIGSHRVEVSENSGRVRVAYRSAANFVAAGGVWRGGKFRRSAEQKVVDDLGVTATVDGNPPKDGAALGLVADHLEVLDAVGRAKVILADVHIDLDDSGSRSTQMNNIVTLDRQLGWISELLTGRDGLVRQLEAISPGGPRPKSIDEVEEVARQAGAIAAANDGQLAKTQLDTLLRQVSHEVEQGPSPEGDALLAALRSADAAAIGEAMRGWRAARSERESQGALDLLELRLEQKAPELRKLMSTTAENPEWDQRLRVMDEAWAWRRAVQWISDRVDPDREGQLEAELDTVDADIAHYSALLAAACAWRECLEHMTVGEVQALQSYRDHITKIGKGSGKHAERFRRAARSAMSQARSAVPAWVMPISQVLSSIDPAPDSFDVVIVDEASQADITSLFLLWLAPRVIVVGDDRQCAPGGFGGVGMDDVFAKLDTLLPDIPQYMRDSLTPRSSLFSMLRTRFGHVVRLREHFRSMPEIIEFSSRQFYPDAPLVPVRQFAGDRLTPLKCVAVQGETEGTGASLVNRVEATALVDAVVNCIADPSYAGMSFGVVVLQGQRQIDVIYQMLRERIGEDEWVARRLRVGSPPDFQGDERQVVFVSMVVAPNTSFGVLTRSESQRRINVAASRAMDQLWLVHSVQLADLKPVDLRYSFLNYMQNTDVALVTAMPTNVSDEERSEPFESVFEQQVFNELQRKGFHVNPKVTVNNRTVDLVVTGMHARLAVECDGDEFTSTPEQARADMERERELRRCGWRFWRVRESEYLGNHDATMSGLLRELAKRGVQPATFAGDGFSAGTTGRWEPIDIPRAD